ncbi:MULTISPECIES: acylphosphatase [Rhizobium]|uniref:acylphosphatase n=2 Tax=Rhizobium/Agrobacterium group TaxID=227290 RepID=UPI001B31A7FD|nr:MULTISPECIES: acylphosphatase [Rhizobium]MBX4909316.1 acylphosphatase [Rhizobium bangladeshense]MBX5216186.1 acylphosphatase [Rhizobium sp. NLR9a]MBX5228305.1 acylphosphatase [Rhizobium sp. NLR9b]MBX5234566.1 acylphosphatase [Rhizobium sp. NLR4a]MBX5246886.1 acylphosphatase [Rhizobium sp. NLR3b]
MIRSRQNELRERIAILGDVSSASFVPWIRRHADKLGLSQDFLQAGAERIELEVAGPVELIDMLEMACSLGPIDVWVDEIQRRIVDPISTPKSERHPT